METKADADTVMADTFMTEVDSELAWSTEEASIPETSGYGWKSVVGLTASILATSAVAVAMLIGLYSDHVQPSDNSVSAPARTSPTIEIPVNPVAALSDIPNAVDVDTDLRFFAELKTDGLEPHPQSNALKDAHTVCDMLAYGESASTAVDELYTGIPGITMDQAQFFVRAATELYCSN